MSSPVHPKIKCDSPDAGIVNCRQPDALNDKAMAKLIDDAIAKAIAEFGTLHGQLVTVPMAGQIGHRRIGRGGMR
jgi:hypothetical protein